LPTPPTGEQNQKKRTYDVLPKPDNFIRYRQASAQHGCDLPIRSEAAKPREQLD
jgi:hypothetical protein